MQNTLTGKTAREAIKDGSLETLYAIASLGGPLTTIPASFIRGAISPNVHRRIDFFTKEVDARISRLEISREQILGNEAFTSAVLKAVPIAIQTGNEQKREYLVNGVEHSLLNSQTEDLQHILWRMIDEFTVLHIKILKYFSKNRAFYVSQNTIWPGAFGSVQNKIVELFPELKEGGKPLYEKFVQDLIGHGLLMDLKRTKNATGMATQNKKSTTELGDLFLQFLGV